MTMNRWYPNGAIMLALIVVVLTTASSSSAWDEDGHAIISYLAHDALPKDMPDWLRDPEVRTRLIYLSSEPDRWRGQHNRQLDHENNPEHYIDEELLHPYGLSLRTLPPFRREFIDLMATQRALHPDKFEKRNRKRDKSYIKLSPGLLPYRIAEVQWKIAAGWTQLKTFEKHRDRVSEAMLNNARENIVYHMGVLSHYIGDGAQPLHTTHHHNGWVGPNPNGYTTGHGFHSFIDSGIFRESRIFYETLKDRRKPPRKVSTRQSWKDICEYLYESHQMLVPLYELEKSGKLKDAEGKRFIEDRLLDAASMLAGVWIAAYESSHIDGFRAKRLKERYPKQPGRMPKEQRKAARAEG